MAGKDADFELRQANKKPVNASIEIASTTDLSVPAVDSFNTLIWEHQNFGYPDMNFQSGSSRTELGLHEDFVLRNQHGFNSLFSQRVPHLPTDSGFIERAARLSSFGGSFTQMMSPFPFPLPHSMNTFVSKPETEIIQSQRHEKNLSEDGKMLKIGTSFINPLEDSKSLAHLSGNEFDDAEFSRECTPEESSRKGLDSKKRKKHGEQDLQRNKDTKPKPNCDQNLTTTSASGGKHAKAQFSDLPKDGYVHVRARRGQATNSHSLAERVRREKISERMKFLQDLVPGCSKVTGKAVMLDEIINYVQSLQRQVEFLSMKLVTVYPHTDFNLDESLAKDAFQSSLPPPLHTPQHGILLTDHVGSSSVTIRRPMSIPPASQLSDVWEDELHNVVHMGFISSSPKPEQ